MSVVVTHVLHGREPRVERSFPTDGPFYAGDGGALAYGGPCGPLPSEAPAASAPSSAAAPTRRARAAASIGVRPQRRWAVGAVRPRRGGGEAARGVSWAARTRARPAPLERARPPRSRRSRGGKQGARTPAAAASGTSSGAPPPRIRAEDVRSIRARARRPVAVIAGKELASYDSAWGEVRPWQAQGAARDSSTPARRHAAPRHDSQLIDQRWAATSAGAVQALLDDGRAIEVSPDGVITVWPFTFDRVAIAGPLAFAKGAGGRAFQTLNRGRTWAGIAAPPGPGIAAFSRAAAPRLLGAIWGPGCGSGGTLPRPPLGWTSRASHGPRRCLRRRSWSSRACRRDRRRRGPLSRRRRSRT